MMAAKNSLVLTEFQAQDASYILWWPSGLEEARMWAGVMLNCIPDECQMAEWHRDPQVHPFVLHAGRTAVGYGELWIDESEGEVELARIIVRPSMRTRGIGRELVRLLLARAALSGLERVFVRVVPESAAAIRCYERAEFSRVEAAAERRCNRNQPIP